MIQLIINWDSMGEKNEVNPVEGIRKFPSFPVVLAAVRGEENNVITLGLVHVFSFRPTIIGVGISPSRYSHELFHCSPDFTINVPTKDLVEEAIFCGVSSGRNIDKFLESGLTAQKGMGVASPIILECPVNFECRKTNAVDIGDHTWFFGEVVHAWVDAEYDRERLLMYWGGDFRMVGDIIRRR
jgi:flavin reductase (DIM6/NTAB) family NADH-FMN oxidoreductase RutF